MITIPDIINHRVETGLADLLLTVYDSGYCAGAGIACESAATGLADLLTTLAARHQAEVLALRAWGDPPIRADELPAWLLSLPQQADHDGGAL